jgi:hypothetical protein
MSAEDAEEYTRALGQIMSGGWRQIALAQRLGVPEAIGMTTDAWVRDRIGGYVRLGLDERREAVKELTDPEGEFQYSQRGAAEILGVDHRTVGNDLRRGEYSPPTSAPASSGGDSGGEYSPPEESPEPTGEPSLADVGAEASYPDEDSTAMPTVGDVADGVAAAWDDEGAAADQAFDTRLRAMRNVRIGWLRFISEHPPAAFVDGMGLDEMHEVVRALDRVIDWLQQARVVAANTRGPRRIEA